MDEELDPTVADDTGEDYGTQLQSMASSYDLSGVTNAYNKVTASAEATRKALQDARARIMERKFDRTQALFALSAGLLAPTRTGNFFESFGNMSRNLIEPIREKRAFELQRDRDLMGVDTSIAGIDDRLAQSALSLESLKAKLGAQAAIAAQNEPNEKVLVNGKPVYMRRSQARGQQVFVPPSASTNISVNTGKSLYETLGDAQAKKYSDMWNAARVAPEMAARAQRIRDAMQKTPYTGSLADYQLVLGKTLQALGINYAKDAATNTEQLAVEMARSTLDAIKSSGLAGSQGLTEGERKFLERAVAGQITLEPKTIMQLADLNERAARLSAEAWNNQYSLLDPQQMRILGMTPIDVNSQREPTVITLEDLPPMGAPAQQTPQAPKAPTIVNFEDLK